MPDEAEIELFRLNPAIDVAAAAARFAATGRTQIRDLLTPAAAATLHAVLSRGTDWGMAVEDGRGARDVPPQALRTLPPAERQAIAQGIGRRVAARDYAFLYMRYPMVTAYLERRDPDGPLHLLLEHLNDQPLMDLVRAVSGIDGLIRADAQATLFMPGQFLGLHDDADIDAPDDRGRRVAYVLNLATDWHPDWGGYLNFFDADGDVIEGFAPRFNALNLFRVPQRHHVSFVPNWAPAGRFAITGWFRDR
jgi:Rps23 Pro-64 3,4-dihydroxylase Tpa1-like proline 4-hydroxylase